MREEFEKLAAAGKIEPKHIEALAALHENGFCMHRSWGFGKVASIDPMFCRVIIDFHNKPGHQMDLAFAADSLKPIPKDHILARKISDPQALRQMAALNHLDLIKLVLRSFGGRATIDQIQQALVPDIIQSDWKKWWETAKKELKKDGHFLLPTKKSDPLLYQEQQTSLQDRLMGEFRAAKGLKNRLNIAYEVHKNLADLTDKAGAVREMIPTLNAEIVTHQRTQTPVALEAIFIRDELRDAAGMQPSENEISAKAIWLQESKIGALMEQLPGAKHRRAVQSFKEAYPENWQTPILNSINFVSAKLATEFAHVLIQGGKLQDLKDALARLISQHQASSELLLWLAKERSDEFADILGPEVFRAMLTAMERDQFNEKRSNRLRDFILDDQTLILELLESADLEVIKDVTRALQLSPSFEDMDKRSLLARIVKNYPDIQSLITGEQTKQENSILVSWASLEHRREEYNELVQKKIPTNSKEIAHARSYGDLRENFEYKAAKDMQRLLMRRKHELESDLMRARGTDFDNPRTDVVSPGTRVDVTDLSTDQRETFTILGAWDPEPEKNIISYLTPLAQSLLNKKAGEEVEFDMDEQKRRYRIERIESAKAGEAQPAS